MNTKIIDEQLWDSFFLLTAFIKICALQIAVSSGCEANVTLLDDKGECGDYDKNTRLLGFCWMCVLRRQDIQTQRWVILEPHHF